MTDYYEATKRAKKWGREHGYEGRAGGWIYRTGRSKAVCQGWAALYERRRSAIEESRK